MSEPTTKSNNQYRVLIVDDEEILLNVMSEVLEFDNYNVDTALDGVTALKKINANKYDLVITDLSLTDIVGWDLADKISIIDPKCKIILATGWGIKINAQHCTKHKINGLLYKPFKMTDILETVKKVLAGSRKEVVVASV